MEAATAPEPAGVGDLPSEKAGRIVEAMRLSVAERGFSRSTFDHVARRAGVSRGLLHYHFGTKEQLLLEAVRREFEVRHTAVEHAVGPATTPEAVLAALTASFEDFLGSGPSRAVMFFEVLTLAQRSPEIASELAALGRRMRSLIAEVLRRKADDGVLARGEDPELTAGLLFVLVDGIVVRRLSEPDLDIGPLIDRAVGIARTLLG